MKKINEFSGETHLQNSFYPLPEKHNEPYTKVLKILAVNVNFSDPFYEMNSPTLVRQFPHSYTPCALVDIYRSPPSGGASHRGG